MDKLNTWLSTTPYADYAIAIASADASFRKYFRLSRGSETLLLMDAALEKSALAPFVDVTERLRHGGVSAPQILYADTDHGYLIIEDFGATHYLDVLNTHNFQTLYDKAIDTIVQMQQCDASGLPLYDKNFLHVEMNLMREWYLEKHLQVTLNKDESERLEQMLDAISSVVLSQPQGVFVHRDYHSRNIMLAGERIGIIDYQDAMNGGITYDLVSLLKDCYIAFDRNAIETLVLSFRDKKGLHVSDAEFLKWFDFTGMQRHIKVLGIFSRLYLRDGKAGYLDDIPLTRHYLLETAQRYEESRDLAALI